MLRIPLHELLYTSTISNLGSDEHLQIAGILKDAKKIVVDTDAAHSVRSLLDRDPWQFEKHLDVVERPDSPIWFEWDIATRAGHGGNEEAATGCLIVPHPASDDLLLVITGWTSGETDSARHAYGVALIGISNLQEIALFARQTKKRGKDDSFDRIMNGIETTMPSGFRDEILILSDDDPNALEAAFRDATAEIPYLLALLISLKCSGGLEEADEGDGLCVKLAKPIERSFLRNLSDKLLGRSGYISGRDELRWYR